MKSEEQSKVDSLAFRLEEGSKSLDEVLICSSTPSTPV